MCSSQSISGLISAAQHTEKTSVGWWWAGKHWEKPLNHFGSSSFPAEDALPIIPSHRAVPSIVIPSLQLHSDACVCI